MRLYQARNSLSLLEVSVLASTEEREIGKLLLAHSRAVAAGYAGTAEALKGLIQTFIVAAHFDAGASVHAPELRAIGILPRLN